MEYVSPPTAVCGRMRNFSEPSLQNFHPHYNDYNDLEFYSTSLDQQMIKKEKMEPMGSIPPQPLPMVPLSSYGYEISPPHQAAMMQPPPQVPPSPQQQSMLPCGAPEDISLEDIMALVDPGISNNTSFTVYQHRLVERQQSLPTNYGSNEYQSELHQALTQPRLSNLKQQQPPPLQQPQNLQHVKSPTCQPQQQQQQPVICTKCNQELSSKCLVQACVSPSVIDEHHSQQTKCRDCGKELTAKCILDMCCKTNVVKVAH